MGKTNAPNFKEDFLAQWIEGKLSDDELKKLVSEEDYGKLLKLRSGIYLHERLEAPTDQILKKIKKKIGTETSTSQPKTISLYYKLAMAAAATLLLFFGIRSFWGGTSIIESSGFGEQKSVSLLDGSTVVLNARSNLKYDKDEWDTKREVYVDGEAFFKVKEGNTFTVNTDNGSVRVLGTHFNVVTFDDFFETICYKGKVKVITGEKEFELLPKQSVRKHKGMTTPKTLEDLEEAPLWLLGSSNFKEVPLERVLWELENQFEIQIDRNGIDSPTLFTGEFEHDHLEDALKSVFDSYGINFSVSGNNVKLSN